MLVLSRKIGESIIIGEDIVVTVIRIEAGRIKVGVAAPTDVPVHRKEIHDKLLQQERDRAQSRQESSEQAGGPGDPEAGPEADRIYATTLAERDGAIVVRTPDVVRGVVDDLLRQVPAAQIAARFHATLADVMVGVCEQIRARTAIATARPPSALRCPPP